MRTIVLIVTALFLAVSFNAYACLVPTPASLDMSPKCPSNDEQPKRTLCDAVKILEIQTVSKNPPLVHLTVGHPSKDWSTAANPMSSLLISGELSRSSMSPFSSQAQRLVSTSVLRI